MKDVYITSVGQTMVSSSSGMSHLDLARNAVNLALVDAGLVKADIQATFWASANGSPEHESLNLPGSVEIVTGFAVPGSGANVALQKASEAIKKGTIDVALVLETGIANCKESVKSVAEQVLRASHSNDVMVQALATRLSDKDLMASKAVNPEIAGTQFEDGHSHISRCRHSMSLCPMLNDEASSLILCSEDFLRKLKQPLPVQMLASVSTAKKAEGGDVDEIIIDLVNRAYDEANLELEGLGFEEIVISYGCSDRCLRELVSYDSTEYESGYVNTNANISGLHRLVDLATYFRVDGSTNTNSEAVIGAALTGASGASDKSEHFGLHIFKRVQQ